MLQHGLRLLLNFIGQHQRLREHGLDLFVVAEFIESDRELAERLHFRIHAFDFSHRGQGLRQRGPGVVI